MKIDCPKHTARANDHAAFTLVELLAVIAVIGLLAGLLLPGLSKAKSKAQSAACANNVRQFQIAATMYASDHRGYFPPSRDGNPFGFFQGVDGAWVLGNAKRDRDDSNIRKGVIFDYVGAVRTYRCPSDRSALLGKPGQQRFRSYMLSMVISDHTIAGSSPYFFHPSTILRDLQAANPSGIFSFLCVNERSIDCSGFALGVDSGDPNRFDWWNTPGERHLRGANLAFIDGNVQYHRWRFTPKLARGDSTSGPVVNDLDRQDLLWLLERTPYWYWDKRKQPKIR
jgi:general secretion pathway protein G